MADEQSLLALEFKVFEGDKLLVAATFEQTKIVIGRILSADLKVPHARVSRIHALVEVLDVGKLRITDLGSTHGTFVNGQRVIEKTFSPKDSVEIGSLKVLIAPLHPDLLLGLGGGDAGANTDGTGVQAEGNDLRSEVAPLRASEFSSGGVSISPDGQVSREPTQIRGLKKIARSRGVLERSPLGEELELTIYWGENVLAVDHFGGSRTVSLGERPGVDYLIPQGTLGPRFDFLRVEGRSVTIQFHPLMKGSLRRGEKMETVEDLQKQGQTQAVITGNDIAKISVGSLNFFLMFVPRPPKTPLGPVFDQGPLFWSLQFAMMVLVTLFISFLLSLPQTIEGTVREFPERMRRVIVQNYKAKVEKREQKLEQANAGTNNPNAPQVTQTGGNEGEGAKEQGAEGKRGSPTSQNQTGITNRPKMPQPTKTVDAPTKATQQPGKAKTPSPNKNITATQQAKPTRTDVLETLRRSGLSQKIASSTGGSAGAAGQDPLDKALSGVGGGQQSSQGAGGSGLQGAGTGGGGTAVGVGGLGTTGFGGGAKGDGVGSIPGKGEVMVGVEGAGVSVIGGLTREQIRKVVESHENEIVLCYQQALQRNPGLSGKVTMSWTIISGGVASNVDTVENSTGARMLQDCLRRQIRNWKFPSPPGGSKADVEWPWVFRPIER